MGLIHLTDWGFELQLVPPNIPFKALKRRKTMPSLEEIYKLDVALHGEDSLSAKMLKRQIECEKYSAGRSFQQLFEDELGPKVQEIFNDEEA